MHHGVDVHASYRDGTTSLDSAVAAGHLAVVKAFVQECAVDLHARNAFGETLLHVAVENAQREIVCYLLDKGVDCEVKNRKGESPLFIATGRTRMNAQLFVRDYQSIFELLLRHGAHVNTQNNWGQTPLHNAVLGWCMDLIRFLVDHGAIIDTPDDVGKTPLFYAVTCGYLSIIEFLLQHGADIYSTNQYTKTSLLAAALSYRKINYDDVLIRVLEFGVPFTNTEEITTLREMQKHGFDADGIIRKRRRKVEEVVLGKPSRVPKRIQRGLRVLAQRERIPRVFAGPIQWSVSRRDRIAGIRDFPPGVLRIIVDYSVTPYLPILE